MLKEIIICIIIVVAIIFVDTLAQNYTKESVSELNSDLMSLREKMTQENIDNGKIQSETDYIYKKWEARHNNLAYFIEHDELEKVETDLVAMKSYIETEEYEESISEVDKCVFILEHIEDKYAFNLQNIF